MCIFQRHSRQTKQLWEATGQNSQIKIQGLLYVKLHDSECPNNNLQESLQLTDAIHRPPV